MLCLLAKSAVAIASGTNSFPFVATIMAQVSALKRVVRKVVQLPSIAFARGRQDERLPQGADTKLWLFEWD